MAKIDWSQYKEDAPKTDWSQYKEDAKGVESPVNTWESFGRGLSQSYPNTLKYQGNALGELFGKQPFQEQEEQPTGNWPEYLGRLTGKIGGYATTAIPAGALGASLAPGLLGASLGAGAAGALLNKGDWKDRALSGLIEGALPATGKALASTGRLAKSALTSVKARPVADIIQKAHEVAKAEAIAPLQTAAKEAASAGLPPIRIDKNAFKLAKRALPNTPAYRDMFIAAKKGDHEAVRRLQTDMGKEARLLKDSDSAAERKFGEELDNARNTVNESMFNHYQKHDRPDLSSMVKTGMKKYAKMIDMYDSNKTIRDLVGKEKKVPENLIKTISQDWSYFKKLRDAHPELKPHLQRQADQEFLKKYGLGGLGLGEGANIIKGLTEYDRNKNN